MDDIEILQELGLALEDEQIIFYDDSLEEYQLDMSIIKEITIEDAYTPIQSRLSYWFSFLAVVRTPFGSRRLNAVDDYRKNYELEIELKDGRVLSRRVKNINLYDVNIFVENLNSLLEY